MLITPKRKAKFFKFFKITRLPYLLFSLGIETGNICNLKCPLCPTGANDPAMKKGFMGLNLFKDILGQLKSSIMFINMYSWGEPLLNPDFIPMVQHAKKINRHIKITTSTNLNIENNELLKGLLNAGLDEIIVSCDGASPGTYAKYRLGGDFDLVMRNLHFLVTLKKQTGAKTNIVWNYLVFKHNEDEIEEAKKIAHNLGLPLRLGKMRTYMKDEILRPHAESIKKYKSWIPDRVEFSAYDKEKETTKIIVKTCRKPWQEISINWDGKVFPCCAVYGDEFSFGNVREDPVREVWNNAMYTKARHEIISKAAKACTICGICRDNGFMHM